MPLGSISACTASFTGSAGFVHAWIKETRIESICDSERQSLTPWHCHIADNGHPSFSKSLHPSWLHEIGFAFNSRRLCDPKK